MSPRGVGRELTGLHLSTGASLPPDHPGHLSERNSSDLFTSPSPDPLPLPFLSVPRTLLTNPATWASTPSAATGTGNATPPLVVPGTRPRGTLLPRSAAGGRILQNTTRLRFLLTVGCHSREQFPQFNFRYCFLLLFWLATAIFFFFLKIL